MLYTVLIRKYGRLNGYDTLARQYRGNSIRNIAVIPNTSVKGKVIGHDRNGRTVTDDFSLDIGHVLIHSSEQIALKDIAFERYLVDSKIDSDSKLNGLVSKKDASIVEVLNFRNGPLRFVDYYPTNLDGIEHFASLKLLDVCTAFMDSLNVSKNEDIISLNCSGLNKPGYYISKLRYIEMGTKHSLSIFNFSDTKINTINLSSCTGLTELFCSGTDLRELKPLNSPSLEVINSSGTDLLSIDLSQNIKLRFLDCSAANSGKSLTTLNVSNNIELVELYCINQSIKTSLDLCTNTKLSNCRTDYTYIPTIYVPFGLTDSRLLKWKMATGTVLTSCLK